MAHSCTRWLVIGGLIGGLGCADDGMSHVDDGTSPLVERSGLSARAYLRGDNVILEIESDQPLYRDVCSSGIVMETRVGDAWQPRRYEVPQRFHRGYYLDDDYVVPTFGLGCDTTSCFAMNGGINAGAASEVVASGTREAPAWAVGSNAQNPAPVFFVNEPEDPAPVFVSVPLAGPLRVELQYSTSPQCSSFETLSVTIDVPDDGVCCPVGEAGCASEGPAGGWAPSLDACREWNGAADEYAERFIDARGCPALHTLHKRPGDGTIPDCTP